MFSIVERRPVRADTASPGLAERIIINVGGEWLHITQECFVPHGGRLGIQSDKPAKNNNSILCVIPTNKQVPKQRPCCAVTRAN